jgi:two-component system, cell cycle response regulator DivK
MTFNKIPEPGHTPPKIAKSSPTDVSDWRVLIVDDVFDNISIAEAVLLFNHAKVKHAINGREGLDMIEDYKPNLILLDLSMPEMNGWEMHKALQQSTDTASIPVIALTAHAMQGDKEKVMEAGFDGYIAKPFSVTTLVDEIKDILKTLNMKANK